MNQLIVYFVKLTFEVTYVRSDAYMIFKNNHDQ